MDQIKDASSFFLWEHTADSEVDSSSHEESAVDDQEDARSCSCDDASARALDFQDDGDGDGDHDAGLVGDGGPDQLDGRRQSSGQMWRDGPASECESGEEEEEEEAESSNVGAMRNMNEMEDKLFWDTCMTGGYP